MRIVLLHNPSAGRARARPLLAELLRAFAAAGVEVDQAAIPISPSDLARRMIAAGAIVIAGGDGSVHHALSAALEVGIPLCHVPLGTENLFARETGTFGAPASAFVDAVRTLHIRELDVGLCAERPFVLMASIGFDAAVVARVAARRVAGVSRLTYVRHAAAEFAHFSAPPLTIHADGELLVSRAPGIVVVANSPHYAARLNPCAAARADDRKLDVLFIPVGSRTRLAASFAALCLGRCTALPGVRTAAATHITVTSDAAAALQIDGEAAGALLPHSGLNFRIGPQRLKAITIGQR